MKIGELRELLKDLSEQDLAEGSNINDHPCSVAIKVIDDAYISHFGEGKYEDIETDRI